MNTLYLRYKFNIKLILLFISSLLLANCSREEEERLRDDSRNLTNPKSTFIYNMIPQNDNAEISPEYSKAINKFSSNLLTQIYKDKDFINKNVVISPFSISRNLAVITEGSIGNTKQELLNSLGGQIALDDAKNALSELLYADQSVVLQCADAIWVDSTKFTLISSFKNIVNTKYGVEIENLSFGNVNKSINSINNWISTNTNKRINNFITKDDFKNITAMFIANAIYFEADWSSPFNKSATQKEEFFSPNGSITVNMMKSDYYHETYKTDTYENAKLYYGDSNIDFFYLDIYMPISGTIDNFMETEMQTALNESKTMSIGSLKMPKFFFESKIDLIPILKKLGIESAFDPHKSEITEMTKNYNLYIDKITHKAGIKTDEEGTEAYAVTVSNIGGSCAGMLSPDVVLNNPFIYFIRAGKNGLVLFAGVVNNPNNSQCINNN